MGSEVDEQVVAMVTCDDGFSATQDTVICTISNSTGDLQVMRDEEVVCRAREPVCGNTCIIIISSILGCIAAILILLILLILLIKFCIIPRLHKTVVFNSKCSTWQSVESVIIIFIAEKKSTAKERYRDHSKERAS